MIAVVQRVERAAITVDGEAIGAVGRGIVALVSIVRDDVDRDVAWMANKLAGLRVFPSDKGEYDRDVRDVGGGLLLVSNFTVAADCTGGRRPSFVNAMPPDAARPMFDRLVAAAAALNVSVATGRFGAEMRVEIVNDGPLTLIVDSRA